MFLLAVDPVTRLNLYEDRCSHELIRTHLAKPGYMKAPGVLAVWHETLVELGLENTQS